MGGGGGWVGRLVGGGGGGHEKSTLAKERCPTNPKEGREKSHAASLRNRKFTNNY